MFKDNAKAWSMRVEPAAHPADARPRARCGHEVRRRAWRHFRRPHGQLERPRRVRARATTPAACAPASTPPCRSPRGSVSQTTVAAHGRGNDYLSHRRAQRLRRRLARLSHRGDSSNPSPIRRRIPASSSTRPKTSTAGPPAPTKAGLQVVVHAIGDRAIRLQLDIYERVAREQHPAIRASASSTPSTSLRPTFPASRNSA